MPKTKGITDPGQLVTRREEVEGYVRSAIEAYDREVIQRRYGRWSLRRAVGRWVRHGFETIVGVLSLAWITVRHGPAAAKQRLAELEKARS